jgi:hypothetical protein
MKLLYKALALVMMIVMGCHENVEAQDSASVYNKILHFPDRLFKKVDDKAGDINNRLVKQTNKYLGQMARQEAKLKKKLAKKDSVAASRLFDDAQKQYAELQSRMNGVSGKALALGNKATSLSNKYLPHLDSLKTAFSFLSKADGLTKSGHLLKTDGLEKVDGILKNVPDVQGKLKDALGKMDNLQDKFNQAEAIKQFIQQRRQLLQEQLGKFGMLKELQAYKKQVYYYQAQVDEYKNMFDDPSKLEAKALDLLKNTQAFRDFFAKNSQLASMFRLPASPSGGYMVSLAGLQTRESVQQDMLQRFGTLPDVQQVMHQQVQGAKDQLTALKDKVNKMGGGNSDKEMPDFKPNNQKTKSLKQRLEFGSNLQTVKSNKFFPSTTDIGLSLGYKLNDKSTIGLGGSYKMGWGKDIRHISISHQGVGVRSFVDYKIKGTFWLSGGAEMNYRSQFSNFEVLDDYSAWQKSALIGVSKKYQVSKKVKGDAQLMYDALWKQQVPRTQPVVFRIGYGFN